MTESPVLIPNAPAVRQPSVRLTEAAVAPAPGPASAWRKLYGSVDQRLALTSPQQATVQEILRDRENEIKAFHESIRNSGLLDIRQYEWRVALMKDGWYRRIDAVLDGAQHGLFVTLVGQGFLNEGLAFTIEPGITVVD